MSDSAKMPERLGRPTLTYEEGSCLICHRPYVQSVLISTRECGHIILCFSCATELKERLDGALKK